MQSYEFEYYSENGREIAIVELASNTEASNRAYRWLREKRAEIYRQLHPRMTRPEKKAVLAALPWFYVSVGRPVDRVENGDIDFNSHRK